MADIDLGHASITEATTIKVGDRLYLYRTENGKFYIDPAFFAKQSDLGAISTVANTAKAVTDSISNTGSGSIINVAERSQIINLIKENTNQNLTSTTPSMDVNDGYNATLSMAGNTVIDLVNLTGVQSGVILLLNTNGATVSLTNNGTVTNVVKMFGTEDLPPGPTDTAILTWIYNGTYLTYNIGKRTQA